MFKALALAGLMICGAAAPALAGPSTIAEAVAAFERSLVEQALREANGVQTRAAELLGTTRRILKYRMDKLRIADASPGETPAESPPVEVVTPVESPEAFGFAPSPAAIESAPPALLAPPADAAAGWR